MKFCRNPISPKRRNLLSQQLRSKLKKQLFEPGEELSDEQKVELETQLSLLLDQIGVADPTPSGKYAAWIARLVMRGNTRLPEDTENIKARLTQFDQKKNLLPANRRDLNQFKTFGELASTLDEILGVMGNREERRVRTQEGQEVIIEQEPFRVIKVTTPEAAAKLARHTDWCIKDPEFSQDYLKCAPLYFIDKNDKRHILAYYAGPVNRSQFEIIAGRLEQLRHNNQCLFCSGPFLCPEHIVIMTEAGKALQLISDEEREQKGWTVSQSADYIIDELLYNWPELKNTPIFADADLSGPNQCPELEILGRHNDDLTHEEVDEVLPILNRIYEFSESEPKLLDFINWDRFPVEQGRHFMKQANLPPGEKPRAFFEYWKDRAEQRWPEFEPQIFARPDTAAQYYFLTQDQFSAGEAKELADRYLQLPDKPTPKFKSRALVGVDEPYKYQQLRDQHRKLEEKMKEVKEKTLAEVREAIERDNEQRQMLEQAASKVLDRIEKSDNKLGMFDALRSFALQFLLKKPNLRSWTMHFVEDVVNYYGKGFIMVPPEWLKARTALIRGLTRLRRSILTKLRASNGLVPVNSFLQLISQEARELRRSKKKKKIGPANLANLKRRAENAIRRNPVPIMSYPMRKVETGHHRGLRNKYKSYQHSIRSKGTVLLIQLRKFLENHGLRQIGWSIHTQYELLPHLDLRDLMEEDLLALEAPLFVVQNDFGLDDLSSILEVKPSSSAFTKMLDAFDKKPYEKTQYVLVQLRKKLLNTFRGKGVRFGRTESFPAKDGEMGRYLITPIFLSRVVTDVSRLTKGVRPPKRRRG